MRKTLQTRHIRRLLLALCVALGSSGCVDQEVLKSFAELDVRNTVLANNPALTGLMAQGAAVGRTFSGAALVLLCLVLGFRAYQGQPWLALAKECCIGGLVCAWLLTTYTFESGPVRYLATTGWMFYDQTTGEKSLFSVLIPRLARDANWMQDFQESVDRIQDPQVRQQAMVRVFQFSQPFWTSLFGTNVLWIFILRYILLATYAFLIAFYWVLTPYVVWTVVLPQTRPVFKGFVQSYVAVCIWPLLLGVVERLIGALPWDAWLPPISAEPLRGASDWTHNQLVLFSMNAVFLSAVASIPVVASKMVSGAVRSAMK